MTESIPGCSAAWSDLIVSSADNRVTNCCNFFGPAPATFGADGKVRPLAELWNSPEVMAIRRLQSGGQHTAGCTGCAHSIETAPGQRLPFFEFTSIDPLNGAQRANMERAIRLRQSGALHLDTLPVRYVLFFGWFCNLTCTICNQVPHRDHMAATLSDDLFEQWREQFATAIQVECIGGEPFTIPPAIAFMRKFAAAPDMEPVRLRVTTNGTVLHKHLDWLKGKERVSLNVSIDSVAGAYETIRAGGTWTQVRDNLLRVRDIIATSHPHWRLDTNALLTRTGITALPDFARFHVDNGIGTYFQTLVFTRGNEEALYREDVLRYPVLLDGLPGWRDSFAEAIAIFEGGGQPEPAATLRTLLDQLNGGRTEANQRIDPFERLLARVDGAGEILRLMVGSVGSDHAQPSMDGDMAYYSSTDNNFGLVARINFQGGVPGGGDVIGLRLTWPSRLPPGSLRCHATLPEGHGVVLKSWTERRDGDDFIIDMIAHNTMPPGTDVPLLIALMNAGLDSRNVLPVRLEVWVPEGR